MNASRVQAGPGGPRRHTATPVPLDEDGLTRLRTLNHLCERAVASASERGQHVEGYPPRPPPPASRSESSWTRPVLHRGTNRSPADAVARRAPLRLLAGGQLPGRGSRRSSLRCTEWGPIRCAPAVRCPSRHSGAEPAGDDHPRCAATAAPMASAPPLRVASRARAVRASEVRPSRSGLPFPMVWQMAGIVLSTLVIGLVLALDRRASRGGRGGVRSGGPLVLCSRSCSGPSSARCSTASAGHASGR